MAYRIRNTKFSKLSFSFELLYALTTALTLKNFTFHIYTSHIHFIITYCSEVRATAEVIEGSKTLVVETMERDKPYPPMGPGGIYRSNVVIKALPCAQGNMFPLLSRADGAARDLKLDIPSLVAELEQVC